jgi:hypothetical protein
MFRLKNRVYWPCLVRHGYCVENLFTVYYLQFYGRLGPESLLDER